MAQEPAGRISLTLAQLAAALASVECGHLAAVVEIDLAGGRSRYGCPTCRREADWEDLPPLSPAGGGNMLLRAVRGEAPGTGAAGRADAPSDPDERTTSSLLVPAGAR
ncbi:MAG: hypothetical protein ACREPI_02795 [Candidatus Dormibacterales bacterium]